MADAERIQVDTIIFGGGVAGLWLLDELVRLGRSALLLEADRLGAGQTACAQGIIHGGLKYTLRGMMTGSATAIRDMPDLWRDCLAGRRQPHLTSTRVRAEYCHLWRTGSLRSKLGMVGARAGLRIAPRKLDPGDVPDVLRACPGDVYRLDEQVIDPVSLVDDLAQRNRQHVAKIDADEGLNFELDGPGAVRRIELTAPQTGALLTIEPNHVVLTAGAGNAGLCRMVGLDTAAMQRRPLHMVMVRGELPRLNGHCVDAAQTRATITSDIDSSGRVVWQIGGEIAEAGVNMDRDELTEHARREMRSVLPGLDFSNVEWAAYRVDRAEFASPDGRKPDDATAMRNGNVITAWPTKLALAPDLAARIIGLLDPSSSSLKPQTSSLTTRPDTAPPPWETANQWTHDPLVKPA